jgi:carbonic anhydrase
MVGPTDEELRATIGSARGVDASGWEFLTSTDQLATLQADMARIVACPLLPDDLEVGGFVFDVHSGELVPVDVTPASRG